MAKLGTVNGYSKSTGLFGKIALEFDGTVKGLARTAYCKGARAGDTIKANFGLGMMDYVIIDAAHDDRAFGVWAQRI